ncbi:MAG: hypothetical protein M3389_14280 [Actinomycetota bacterium]|nr:hypothetical protein [Actinomycetota bacterium]
MTGRAKWAIGALAACGAAAAAATAGPAGGQGGGTGTSGVPGYGVVFEFTGDAKGIVHAVRRPGAASAAVTLSLHALEPDASYELAVRRRGCTGRVLWTAAFAPAPGADDAYARLRIPLDPDRATGAGGAGLYLLAKDGGRKLVGCAAGRRYRSG